MAGGTPGRQGSAFTDRGRTVCLCCRKTWPRRYQMALLSGRGRTGDRSSGTARRDSQRIRRTDTRSAESHWPMLRFWSYSCIYVWCADEDLCILWLYQSWGSSKHCREQSLWSGYWWTCITAGILCGNDESTSVWPPLLQPRHSAPCVCDCGEQPCR